MSTIYSTVSGDTFVSIARKRYGDDNEASRIVLANPGITEPLSPGTNLSIPAVPGAPVNKAQGALSDGVDEVSVEIDGARFRFWDGSTITRNIDTFDTVSLAAPFEADAPGFRDTFRPLSYKPVGVSVGGEPLFTGTIVPIDPVLTPERKSLALSGYSLPGVLNDCTPPASAFPLEFNGQNIAQIAQSLCDPFGISVVFAPNVNPGAKFPEVAMARDKKVFPFLVDLAQQRGLIISSTPRGELLFLRSVIAGDPVARFSQGSSPLQAITPTFNAQEYYSSVTAIEPARVGATGSQYTVQNPRLEGVIRPFTFTVSDAKGGDVKAAAEAKAARMFANAVSYSMPVPTWRDPRGELWAPNTLVTATAPDAMIYSEYTFLMKSIAFSRNEGGENALLRFVIPGAYSGQLPKVMPWD